MELALVADRAALLPQRPRFSPPRALGREVRKRLPILLPVVFFLAAASIVSAGFRDEFLASLSWFQRTEGSAVAYCALVCACPVVGLPMMPVALTAGFLYGVPVGAPVVFVGGTGSAAVSFAIVRALRACGALRADLPDRIRRAYPELRVLGQMVDRTPYRATLLLRLLSLPLPLKNYGPAILGLPFWPCMVAALCAEAVSCVPMAYAGSLLQDLADAVAGRVDNVGLKALAVCALALTAAALAWFARVVSRRVEAEAAEAEADRASWPLDEEASGVRARTAGTE